MRPSFPLQSGDRFPNVRSSAIATGGTFTQSQKRRPKRRWPACAPYGMARSSECVFAVDRLCEVSSLCQECSRSHGKKVHLKVPRTAIAALSFLAGSCPAKAQCSPGSVRCFGLGPIDPLVLGPASLAFFALGGAAAVWIGLERLFPGRPRTWRWFLQHTWRALWSPESDATGKMLVVAGTASFLSSGFALVAIAVLRLLS
jgi:hypothetical protein